MKENHHGPRNATAYATRLHHSNQHGATNRVDGAQLSSATVLRAVVSKQVWFRYGLQSGLGYLKALLDAELIDMETWKALLDEAVHLLRTWRVPTE